MPLSCRDDWGLFNHCGLNLEFGVEKSRYPPRTRVEPLNQFLLCLLRSSISNRPRCPGLRRLRTCSNPGQGNRALDMLMRGATPLSQGCALGTNNVKEFSKGLTWGLKVVTGLFRVSGHFRSLRPAPNTMFSCANPGDVDHYIHKLHNEALGSCYIAIQGRASSNFLILSAEPSPFESYQ